VSKETFLLVRHALAASNRDGLASSTIPGEGLTREGVDQARRLRELVAAEPIELAAASQLARTQQTVELALDGRRVPRVVLPELNEIGFGSFDGGPLDAYRAWAASQPPSLRPPGGGESRAEAARRYSRGLRLLLERSERTVLVVAHSLAVRYVLDAARGIVPAARIAAVEHAVPHRLSREGVLAAACFLEEWSAAPRFRLPSDEA
jgi:broad specificity phosphatase PhoE